MGLLYQVVNWKHSGYNLRLIMGEAEEQLIIEQARLWQVDQSSRGIDKTPAEAVSQIFCTQGQDRIKDLTRVLGDRSRVFSSIEDTLNSIDKNRQRELISALGMVFVGVASPYLRERARFAGGDKPDTNICEFKDNFNNWLKGTPFPAIGFSYEVEASKAGLLRGTKAQEDAKLLKEILNEKGSLKEVYSYAVDSPFSGLDVSRFLRYYTGGAYGIIFRSVVERGRLFESCVELMNLISTSPNSEKAPDDPKLGIFRNFINSLDI